VDNVRRVRGDFTVEAARQYLARFRFWGDDPLRMVSGFSGGERSRLALAKLLLEPKNLLFLDEPTNHLDIPASEILEEALVGFEGTVVLVSHDRRFLENVTTRIVSVRDGAAEVYPGGFKDYDDETRRRAQAAAQARDRRETPRKSAPPPKAASPEKDAKQKYEAQRQAARDIEKKKRRIQELEASIAAAEKDRDGLRAKLKQGPADDWEKLAKMAQEEQGLTRKVDTMLVEWAKLSEEVK
jgi:ATP-binding cassette subfamily F protein 3